MLERLRKQPLALFLALVLTALSITLPFDGLRTVLGHAVADVAAQASETKTLTRDLEPATVYGAQVPEFADAPVGDLFVYTFDGETLGGQIPVQVDEVADGDYTSAEDGWLDADDEIVLMAMDLGDRPADPTALADTLPISATWYQIQVSDPLSPTQKGWAYLVRSSTLTPEFSDDYVTVTPGTGSYTIDAQGYEARFSTAHPTIDYLALNDSGVDILDRSKIRVVVEVFGVSIPLDEDDLENPDTVLIKPGPVRGILRQTASPSGGGPVADARLATTSLAYASLVSTTAQISFTLPALVDLDHVRMSVDLSDDAIGATFYNADTPGGVTVDGNPDSVDATPLSHWAQVSHSSGRLIHVADPTPAGGTQTNYYCDDNSGGSLECDGTPATGDGVSYGDAGISVAGDINESFTAKSSLYVLPPAGGGQDNVGATYRDYHFNPLTVETELQTREKRTYLPVVLKKGT